MITVTIDALIDHRGAPFNASLSNDEPTPVTVVLTLTVAGQARSFSWNVNVPAKTQAAPIGGFGVTIGVVSNWGTGNVGELVELTATAGGASSQGSGTLV